MSLERFLRGIHVGPLAGVASRASVPATTWAPRAVAPDRAMTTRRTTAAALVAILGMALSGARAAAQSPPAAAATPVRSGLQEELEVTATRIPRPVNDVPASIQVITAEELRARGATDLRGALSLSAGIDVAPGGDGGPAGAVPEIWGLKEADAYLLVVDGVPWGGAFNPAVSTLDLNDVERIEIQRGPAPVLYGATSFVGVVQVVRRAPGRAGTRVTVSGGSAETASLSLATPVPDWLGFASSAAADLGRSGTGDDRTSWSKGHALWRNRRALGQGTLQLDLDATWLRQQPGSPSPRTGGSLDPRVPVGTNQNPRGAHLDEDRYAVRAGHEVETSFGSWASVVAYTRSDRSLLRGFLVDVSNADPNAHGFRQAIGEDDLYADSHLSFTGSAGWRAVAGADWLYGSGRGRGGDFDYTVGLDGTGAPGQLPSAAEVRVSDDRSFLGLYAQGEWLPAPSLRLELGVRLNATAERRRTATRELGTGATSGGSDRREVVRPGGAAGVTWTAWEAEGDTLRVFANAKGTFKPAAADFGLDSPSTILRPETAHSAEAGLKADLRGRTLRVEVAAFQLDFENLVVSQAIGGAPALTNAGSTRFRGVELAAVWQVRPRLVARAAGALHDARFRDYLTEFGGTPTQLAGNRLEMSPRGLGSLSLAWSPEQGAFASAELAWVGERYLNKRNTALAGGYATAGASLGYRRGGVELRATGRNLTDRRDPVAESELGDAQYYRLTQRRIDASVTWRF